MLHSFADRLRKPRRNGGRLGDFVKGLKPDAPASGSPENRDNSDRDVVFVGTDLFASVIVGALLGWFVGRLFGINSQWPLLIGIIFGAVAGFREIYRHVKKMEERERKSHEERRDGGA